jgi:hypothetical protein
MDGLLYTTLLVHRYSTTSGLLEGQAVQISYEVDDPREILRQTFMI